MARTNELRYVTGTLVRETTERLEAYYDVALTPAANLTFDLQWANAVYERLDPALVLGARLRLIF